MDDIWHPLDEAVATQVACRIVKEYGGSINFYRLIKLLYLVEHESWVRLKMPAIGGKYFSMKDGPMISETSDAGKGKGAENFPIWSKHLQPNPSGGGFSVTFVSDAGRDDISDALLEIIDEVIKQTRKMKNPELKDYCHRLKEYQETEQGKRIPISAEDILTKNGVSQEKVYSIKEESEIARRIDYTLA